MIYERIDNCPVCQKTEFRNRLVVEDYTVSHESFAIVQCAGCGFQFTNPRPTAGEIGKYYERRSPVRVAPAAGRQRVTLPHGDA